MTYGTASAVVFLEPIEDGLAQCHDNCSEANHRGGRRAQHVLCINIEKVKESLYDVHECYNARVSWKQNEYSNNTYTEHW